MNVKTISVTYERKWNTGQYESATVGVTTWADLDEGEEELGAAERLWAFVKGQVKEQSLPLLRGRKGPDPVAGSEDGNCAYPRAD